MQFSERIYDLCPRGELTLSTVMIILSTTIACIVPSYYKVIEFSYIAILLIIRFCQNRHSILSSERMVWRECFAQNVYVINLLCFYFK